jgi:hypothetical protein
MILFSSFVRAAQMVERRKELDQRYGRKKKMAKLKAKLAAARDGREKENILKKIHRISPWWEAPKANA